MRKVSKIFHIVIGILLAISTAFQLLALFGGVLLNKYNDFTTEMPWLVPMWCGMLALLIAAFVLVLTRGKKHPWPPIIFVGALVGTVCALIVALALRDALPDHFSATGGSQGLNSWKLLYRHMSSAIVGGCITIEAGIKWIRCRNERQRLEAAAGDLAASTIGLDSFAGDDSTYVKPRKLKRSLKHKKIKADIPAQVKTTDTNVSE